MKKVEPLIVVSACLSGAKKRYDGKIVFNPLINELKSFCKILTICPETEIGLPVPRDRTILYKSSEGIRAIYLGTREDITERVLNYYEKKKKEFSDVDGFILKAKSPSCSVSSTTKTYKDPEGKILSWYSQGLVGKKIKEDFTQVPVVDEILLREKDILEEFLIKIFTIRRFKEFKKEKKELKEFHKKVKYLLMLFSPPLLQELEKTLVKKMEIQEYEKYFFKILSEEFKRGKVYNAILNAFGEISNRVGKGEKKCFLILLDKYKKGKKSYITIIEHLRFLFQKYQVEKFLDSYFFDPYPETFKKFL